MHFRATEKTIGGQAVPKSGCPGNIRPLKMIGSKDFGADCSLVQLICAPNCFFGVDKRLN